jgi:hypothetical protein
MKKKLVRTALVVAGATSAAVALAGENVSQIAVQTSTTGGWNEGTMGFARYSSDTTQAIGCYTYASSSATAAMAYCWASDTSGNYVACQTNNGILIQIAQAINTTSLVGFTLASDGYSCSSIAVQNGSEFQY